jgi:hypothetical protein
MSKVYAVGVIYADLSDNTINTIKDQRLWYIFADFASAEKCVLENQSDIFESSYNIALIEEVSLIDPSNPNNKWEVPKQWWYKATYDINPIIEPTLPLNVGVCFWVG